MGVELVSSGTRAGTTGATLYGYEYELDSTRGRKRIFNTVTIWDSKLYILNGQYKCASADDGGCAESEQLGALLRHMAGSFDVGTQ